MKILIIGNCQVYGCGLTNEEGFVEQFVKKIARSHFFKVQVTCFVTASLKEAVELLLTLEPQLYKYDSIILQLANDELMLGDSLKTIIQKEMTPFVSYRDTCFHGLKTYCASDINYFRTSLADKCGMKSPTKSVIPAFLSYQLLTATNALGVLGRMNFVARQWKVILQLLTSVRTKVVVVTPFPSLSKTNHLLRMLGSQLIVDACDTMGFTYVDSLNLLEKHPYFFLPDGNHLNVLGHKMLANRLYQLFSKDKMSERPSFLYQFSDN